MWTMAYKFLGLYLGVRTMIASADDVPAGCYPHNVIPFRIFRGFTDAQIHMIHDVIAEFNKHTCIRWVDGDKVPHNATERVAFQKVRQSWLCQAQPSSPSKGNKAIVQLGSLCFTKNVVLHEMMHVLGFHHEHQRPDRDCYVSVNMRDANAQGYTKEYLKQTESTWLDRFPYDKFSIMHYPRSNTLKGLYKRRYIEEPLGTAEGTFSFLDLWKILYKFCGFPHYCDVFPEICVFIDEVEKSCAV